MNILDIIGENLFLKSSILFYIKQNKLKYAKYNQLQ